MQEEMSSNRNSDVKILIVEDSPTQAERLKYILEGQDYRVSVAGNGNEALQYLEEHRPVMVISDIVMPEMNGYELCARIKEDERLKNIPVILLTTLSDPADVISGLNCGADNFITKPYEEQFLLTRIHYILLNLRMREGVSTEMGIEIAFAGQKQFITSNRIQILDMLLSTFEAAIQKTLELEEANRELRKANETISTLNGLIPICARCKKIRDDGGYWRQIEEYISEHSEAEFTHGYCPDCAKALYPEYWDDDKQNFSK
jgi:two-component system cell cycle response regulator